MGELKTRIQLRHDTEENWKLVQDEFIPLVGEACLTTDGENKGKVKYGDGASTWGQLPYSGGAGGIDVDSSLVKFDEDFTFTYTFGKYVPDSSGQVNIPASGKTLNQLFLDAFAEEKNPTITQPSVGINANMMKAYEAGTTVTPSYVATLNPGNYQYGPATGITAQTWSVTFNGETKDTATGEFNPIQVGEDKTNLKIEVTATYGDGTIPNTNLGSEYADGQIKAGSKKGASNAITSFRQIFYGVNDGTEPLTSVIVRALTPTNKAAAGMTINSIKAHEGAKRIIIAIPQSSGLRVTAANITSSLNADVTSSYVKQEPVQVEGAEGYTAVPYDCYVYQPASIDPTEDHKIVIGR